MFAMSFPRGTALHCLFFHFQRSFVFILQQAAEDSSIYHMRMFHIHVPAKGSMQFPDLERICE
jgi:hypothetical protein